jgi:hypothetical protein
MATFFPYLLANLRALSLVLRTCLPFQIVGLIPLLKSALCEETCGLTSVVAVLSIHQSSHPAELLFLSRFVWAIGQTLALLLALRPLQLALLSLLTQMP